MKGFINKLVGLACLGAATTLTGCVGYNNLADTCYPERYEHMARLEVFDAFAPQSKNGHVLDQTIWNYHFEHPDNSPSGTDRLTLAGQEKLMYLARRRPQPESVIFLQTANDITYDQSRPEGYAKERSDLDRKRIDAIQHYLASVTAGRPMQFEVVVHDPAMVDKSGIEATQEVNLPVGVRPNGYYLNVFGTNRVGMTVAPGSSSIGTAGK